MNIRNALPSSSKANQTVFLRHKNDFVSKASIKNPSIFNDRRINLLMDKALILLCIKCILYRLIIPIIISIVSFVNHGRMRSNISYSFRTFRSIYSSCFI